MLWSNKISVHTDYTVYSQMSSSDTMKHKQPHRIMAFSIIQCYHGNSKTHYEIYKGRPALHSMVYTALSVRSVADLPVCVCFCWQGAAVTGYRHGIVHRHVLPPTPSQGDEILPRTTRTVTLINWMLWCITKRSQNDSAGVYSLDRSETAHQQILSFFDSVEKSKALSLLLHTADISHPSKPWALHSRWTKALMEEFFRQVGTLIDLDHGANSWAEMWSQYGSPKICSSSSVL